MEPEIAKPKPERSLAQMEALNRARLKAQEVRRANADLKLKERAIAKAEKDQKASEINRRYQALEGQEPAADPAPEAGESAATQPTEEEEEVVYEKAPKPKAPKKRRVVVVQESDSDEEEIEVVLPKKKTKAPPSARDREPPPRRPPNPFMDRPFFHSPFPY